MKILILYQLYYFNIFLIILYIKYCKFNTIDNENPFEIDDKLSFNLSLINNYSFDLYKTDNNILIICFFVKEGNIDKIICYNNTFEEIINSSLEQFPIYKSCDIKKDGKPIFFNYEKISIIYYKKNI